MSLYINLTICLTKIFLNYQKNVFIKIEVWIIIYWFINVNPLRTCCIRGRGGGSMVAISLADSSKQVKSILICSYCSIHSLKEFRAPLFFLSGDNLASYSSLSSFIASLQYKSDDFDKPNYYRRKAFLISHRKSISCAEMSDLFSEQIQLRNK